jgi:uncharacterized protein (DUF433 family)
MIMSVEHDTVPLWTDDHGDIRVTGSRILFDVLIDLHKQGTTPEQIVSSYPSLMLADVYGVLAYDYRHREKSDRYLQGREQEARKIREEVEARQGPLPAELKSRIEAFNAERSLDSIRPWTM